MPIAVFGPHSLDRFDTWFLIGVSVKATIALLGSVAMRYVSSAAYKKRCALTRLTVASQHGSCCDRSFYKLSREPGLAVVSGPML